MESNISQSYPKCTFCGCTDFREYIEQSRSADEPMVYYYVCLTCGKVTTYI